MDTIFHKMNEPFSIAILNQPEGNHMTKRGVRCIYPMKRALIYCMTTMHEHHEQSKQRKQEILIQLNILLGWCNLLGRALWSLIPSHMKVKYLEMVEYTHRREPVCKNDEGDLQLWLFCWITFGKNQIHGIDMYRLIIAFPTRLDSRRTSQTCASSKYVVDSGGLLGISDAKNTRQSGFSHI